MQNHIKKMRDILTNAQTGQHADEKAALYEKHQARIADFPEFITPQDNGHAYRLIGVRQAG